ncbi:hypothetical protein IE53DRAFT_383302 [Violaceomyces palustris]|uniref:Uncharacterized protein n=1 Tax=Violaceomyces palustris TaxID=1673888 RepID=A0ACD0P7Y4_9BASI|nr:hypothetical protein IE53DRAFT_383302 [Violaceomyces palustris]
MDHLEETSSSSSWISTLSFLLALVCLTWYTTIWSICLLGRRIAKTHYSSSPPPTSPLRNLGEESDLPGVSILRPLSGLDSNLFENLCSSFEQDYPKERFEILLSIRERRKGGESEKVFQLAQSVKERYPDVRCEIVVGDEKAGVNPKINNLVRTYSLAKFDILWVIDSQVWSPPGTLSRSVEELIGPPRKPFPELLNRRPHGTRVGLVHHVPLAVSPSNSWGSQVERVFLSTTHAKMYLAINGLSIDSCVMGKSNMYRKSDLEKVPDDFFHVGLNGSKGEAGAIGSRAFASLPSHPSSRRDPSGLEEDDDDDERRDEGGEQPLLEDGFGTSRSGSGSFPPNTTTTTIQTSSRALARFGIYLAEDNMLALSLWRPPLNLCHSLARFDVAHTSVGDIKTLWDYSKRRMRWIRVRKHMVPLATYLEPLTESIPSALVGLFALRKLFLQPLLPSSFHLPMSLIALTIHWTCWYRTDVSVLESLSGGQALPDRERSNLLLAWCLREILALPIWIWAVSGSTVDWREKRYRILQDGRAASASAL